MIKYSDHPSMIMIEFDVQMKSFLSGTFVINIALVNGGFLHYMDMKKFLKNLLRNRLSDFEIILQECSLGDLFQKLFAKFLSVHKHGSGKLGLLALSGHEEILKKSSSAGQILK